MKLKIDNKFYDIEAKYDVDNSYYELKAHNYKGDELGVMTFKFLPSTFGKVWFNYINVYDKYQNHNVGTALVTVFEYICYKHRMHYVEGKYYPENDGAKYFYKKNGYSIDKDYYETYISKEIDYEKMKTEVEPNITNYDIVSYSEIGNDLSM